MESKDSDQPVEDPRYLQQLKSQIAGIAAAVDNHVDTPEQAWAKRLAIGIRLVNLGNNLIAQYAVATYGIDDRPTIVMPPVRGISPSQ